MRVRTEVIEEVRQVARIEEVVAERVSLRRKGQNLWGHCPFHEERTPSFSVSVSKGIFKCFGCGKGGDVFTFLMEQEGLSYMEAVVLLAEKYNVSIQYEHNSSSSDEKQKEKDALRLLMTYAQKYYAKLLQQTPSAQEYLKKRGLSQAEVDTFDLGYAPQGWDTFLKHAQTKAFATKRLVQAGLVLEKNGKHYDRFRGDRLMFALQDATGQTLGFGARSLSQDPDSPKYINSPETPLYHKGQYLYGLHQAKSSIRSLDEAYLVEGYMDLLSLHKIGLHNVVASGGTSLTTPQIRQLGRLTRRIVLLYDGDAAGREATLQAGDKLLEERMNVWGVLLPEKEDPDSYLQQVGQDAFNAYLKKQKKDFFSLKWQLLHETSTAKSTDGFSKARRIQALLESLAKVKDPIVRQTFVGACSTLTGMEETLIKQQLHTLQSPTPVRRQRPAPAEKTNRNSENPMDKHAYEYLQILLCYGQAILSDSSGKKKQEYLLMDFLLKELEDVHFDHPVYGTMLKTIREHMGRGEWLNVHHFLAADDEKQRTVASRMLSETEPYVLSEHWINRLHIHTPTQKDIVTSQAERLVLRIKYAFVRHLLKESETHISVAKKEEEETTLLKRHAQLKQVEGDISRRLGRVIAL